MNLDTLKDQFITAAREYYAATETMTDMRLRGNYSAAIYARSCRAQVAIEKAMRELDTAIADEERENGEF